MPKDQINVGKIFKAHRELLHLTQENVAEKLDVSQQQYQRYEAGTSLPPLNILFKIMELLQIPGGKIFDKKIKDAFDDGKDVEVLKIIRKNPEIKAFIKALDKNESITKSYKPEEIILILKKISKLSPESRKNILDIIENLK